MWLTLQHGFSNVVRRSLIESTFDPSSLQAHTYFSRIKNS
uniref:Uncharacterized protein n=1 Tax=Arundo donax TaxID=35708 RepID=A0A0A9GJI2_ARUDO